MSFQLLNEQHLVDIVAREPIGGGDEHPIELGQGRVIPQAVQAGPREAGATVAVVPVNMVLIQDPALVGDIVA